MPLYGVLYSTLHHDAYDQLTTGHCPSFYGVVLTSGKTMIRSQYGL